MRRYLFYFTVAILAFGIGISTAFKFYWKTEAKFVIVQTNKEINSAKILTQNQTNTEQENDEILSQDFDSINFDDLKIKDVVLGSPHSTVVRQLGKPVRSKKSGIFPCGNSEMTLRYPGLEIKLEEDEEGKKFSVVSIEVTSSKWSVSGISVGTNVNDVKGKFRHRYHMTKESGLEGLHYGNGDGGASFYFRDNKLVKISWEYNWC